MFDYFFLRMNPYASGRYVPELAHPLRRLCGGDGEPAGRLLESTRRDQAWELRHLYASSLGDVDVERFDDWCRCDPLSPDPWLARGQARVVWAWQARTAALGENVPEWRVRLFFQRLSLADRDLLGAAQLCPEDPNPYVFQIKIRMGGSWGAESIHECLNEAIARHPTHLSAYKAAVYALTEQWGGSHDQMLELARSAAEKATWENDLAAILPHAHGLRHFYDVCFTRDQESAAAYRNDVVVQREVETAFDQNFAASQYRERPMSFTAWNDFAYWFYLAEDAVRLKRCLEVLQGRYTYVWKHHFQAPRSVLKSAERMARRV